MMGSNDALLRVKNLPNSRQPSLGATYEGRLHLCLGIGEGPGVIVLEVLPERHELLDDLPLVVIGSEDALVHEELVPRHRVWRKLSRAT